MFLPSGQNMVHTLLNFSTECLEVKIPTSKLPRNILAFSWVIQKQPRILEQYRVPTGAINCHYTPEVHKLGRVSEPYMMASWLERKKFKLWNTTSYRTKAQTAKPGGRGCWSPCCWLCCPPGRSGGLGPLAHDTSSIFFLESCWVTVLSLKDAAVY